MYTYRVYRHITTAWYLFTAPFTARPKIIVRGPCVVLLCSTFRARSTAIHTHIARLSCCVHTARYSIWCARVLTGSCAWVHTHTQIHNHELKPRTRHSVWILKREHNIIIAPHTEKMPVRVAFSQSTMTMCVFFLLETKSKRDYIGTRLFVGPRKPRPTSWWVLYSRSVVLFWVTSWSWMIVTIGRIRARSFYAIYIMRVYIYFSICYVLCTGFVSYEAWWQAWWQSIYHRARLSWYIHTTYFCLYISVYALGYIYHILFTFRRTCTDGKHDFDRTV